MKVLDAMAMVRVQKTERQPFAAMRKPPPMGPITGPMSGPMLQTGHCAAALEWDEHVGHGAAAYSDGSGASDTGKKTEQDKGGQGRGVGASNGEDSKEDVRGMVDIQSSIEFGAWGDEDGTEDVAEDKDRNDEGGKKGVGGVELGHDLRNTGSEHRRGEGTVRHDTRSVMDRMSLYEMVGG